MKSNHLNTQMEAWTGEFGRGYTDRNPHSTSDMDDAWYSYYRVRKSELFRQLLPIGLIPAGRVLEVGCNVGAQLGILHSIHPGLEMYGLDAQKYALAKARALYPDFNFVQGTALDLPFKEGFFDLVMTNGVLIHIHPDDLSHTLSEICRCSRQFIFLHEYYAECACEVTYRGKSGLLWKNNFMQRYLESCPDLRCLEVRYLHYNDHDNGRELTDQVALLKKVSST